MLISSALASTVVGLVFTRYVTSVQEEVKSQRVWKEKSVAELRGPMNIQLNRTKLALDRWNEQFSVEQAPACVGVPAKAYS
jgi:hypothetical protein